MIDCPRWPPIYVNDRVAAILASGGSPSALAAKAAASTIPIVFTAVPEPVQLGLVANLTGRVATSPA